MESYLEDNRPTLDEVCMEYDECTEECPAYKFCHSNKERIKIMEKNIYIYNNKKYDVNDVTQREELVKTFPLEVLACANERFILNFYINELKEKFGIEDEALAEDLAHNAYYEYSQGDGLTEYEALEKAYNDYDDANRVNMEEN